MLCCHARGEQFLSLKLLGHCKQDLGIWQAQVCGHAFLSLCYGFVHITVNCHVGFIEVDLA